MINTKIIGNKISEARKKINISQARLAQHLFISSQAVGKWERGESMPDITTFNRLAEILGVDLNYFSESFQSDTTNTATVERKQEKKPSWNMSLGNWLDADFSGLKNLHEKFNSSSMQHCKFIGSDISGLLLQSNNINNCNFSNSDISNSHIQISHLTNNLFKGCSLKEAEFSKSYIKDCDFSGANLTGVNLLKSNHIDSCDLSGTDISGSQIQSSSLDNNLFKGSFLRDAKFSKSHLKRCDFWGANFTGVEFKSCAFQENKVANAVWNRTAFIDTQITDIIFDGTMEDCYFENCVFNWVKFENSTLINTFFKNNSFKRIRFVDCQTDRITYEFLKNGKADLNGITLL